MTTAIYTLGSLAPLNQKVLDKWEQEYCYCCGRKLGANPFMMHVNTSWELIAPDSTASDSQGCFPIGSTCANQFADGVLFRRDC